MNTHIDTYLDSYASEAIAKGEDYQWWWNGDAILADAIVSLARHVRLDGCHELTGREQVQLETLERYMAGYRGFDAEPWLHAEAMWLLGEWFSRLWD